MRHLQRWFRRDASDASITIGQSRIRLKSIESVLFLTRTDDPTVEALVTFRPPRVQVGSIQVRYRGRDAEQLRAQIRPVWHR